VKLAVGSVLAALCAIAFITSFVLNAQATGSRLGPRTIPRTKPELVFDKMMNCFVTRHRSRGEQYMEHIPGSLEQDRAYASLSGALDVCLSQPDLIFEGQELVFGNDRLHRGLGYFLLRERPSDVPLTLPGSVDQVPWYRGRLESVSQHSAFAIGVERFGHCVVTSNWADSRQVVFNKVQSKEAKAATKALQTAMNSCLLEGESLTIDPRLFPHVLGDAMYHIMARQRVGLADSRAREAAE
jgi:hypothetical protein